MGGVLPMSTQHLCNWFYFWWAHNQ